MKESSLMKNINYHVRKSADVDIKGLSINSKTCEDGFMFVCIRGLTVDGHKYIRDAVSRGAVAVLTDKGADIDVDVLPPDVAVWEVEDTRRSLGHVAANFFENPSVDLNVYGVTGTNGKTSVTYFVDSLLRAWGKKSCIIGTTGVIADGEVLDIPYATSTTPDPIELHRIFAECKARGFEHIAMEVTSHALALNKVDAVLFNAGIFTNLTQDHLDFHGSMDSYLQAKAKLFDGRSRINIINMDDPAGVTLAGGLRETPATYSIDCKSYCQATQLEYTPNGTTFTVNINGKPEKFSINVPGRFSVYNALCAIALGVELQMPVEVIREGLQNMKGVPGRFNTVANDKNIGVIVDYAHSPDSLKNIIESVRGFTTGRVITVFGCGGDRDNKKRPIMGEIAGRLSDYCILTSDNPRSEVPAEIVRQIEVGTKPTGCAYECIVDREQAIARAIEIAKAGDTVIIAGKGHEDYQEFENHRRVHFDDREMAEKYLNQ